MDVKKLCYRCREIKSVIEYNKNYCRIDGLQSWCRECNRQKSKAYYADNASRQKVAVSKRKKQQYKLIRARIDELKRQNPCVLCGEKEPVCLDFHHKDPKQKVVSISQMAKLNWGFEKVELEIKKCVMLCSNCHRKLHVGIVSLS